MLNKPGFSRSLFWKNLTRTIDSDGLETICADPKNRSRDVAPRIYVPTGEPEIYEYYQKVAASKPQLNLQVERLPQNITPAYFMTLNDKPGILALAMRKVIRDDGQPSLSGIPFVVPGARSVLQFVLGRHSLLAQTFCYASQSSSDWIALPNFSLSNSNCS